MTRPGRDEKLAQLKEQLSQVYLGRDQPSAHDVTPLLNHLQQIDWLLVAVLGERIRCQEQLDGLLPLQLSAASLSARMNHVLERAEKLAFQLDVDTHLVEQVVRIVEASAINQSLTRHFKASSARSKKTARKEPAPIDRPDKAASASDGGTSAS